MKQQEVTKLESGQVITHHAVEDCSAALGRPGYCPLHKQEPGPWQTWPRHWDSAGQVITRECPCGVIHPASEVYGWSLEHGQGWKLGHSCCGKHICTSWPPPQLGQVIVDDMFPNVQMDDFKIDKPPSFHQKLLKDALDLVIDLWPQVEDSTLDLRTWKKLRRVLLAVPGLVAELEELRGKVQ